MKKLRLDITLPVLNEEQRLELGVTKTIAFLDDSEIEHYSITIADNGSFDNTEKIARSLVERFPCVRFIKVEKKGVGLALKQSWTSSDAALIGYMDVDLATDLSHLIDAYRILRRDEVDIVNGSRLLPDSLVINRSLMREISSLGFNFFLKKLLKVNFTDGMCGFKFLKKTAFNKLTKKGLDNNEWFFCTELLVQAEWLGMQIREIPVHWSDDRDSRVELFKTIKKYSGEIRRLQLQKDRKL